MFIFEKNFNNEATPSHPENHDHIALKNIRRLDIYWTGDDIKYYDSIKLLADKNKVQLSDFIKKLIADRPQKK